jgi:tRNA(adenine34) deaminase
MEAALAQASTAKDLGEVPVGAMIARNGQIISSGHNRRIMDNDPTAHAEIIAIRRAAEVLGDWRLNGCTLYVTLEPCCMCAGAMVLARLDRVVYGTTDPKAGAIDTLFQLCCDDRLNHRVEVTSGVLQEKCAEILTAFFKAQRALGKK